MSQNPNNGGGDASTDSSDSDYTVIDSAAVTLENEAAKSKVSIGEQKLPTKQELLKENKRLRIIYADAGLEYGRDAKTKKQMKHKRHVAYKIRNEQLLKTIKIVALARNVELCFVVDATGSMIHHIQGVKNAIREIVNTLKAAQDENVASAYSLVRRMRIGVVAYRDYGYTTRFDVLKFTDSVKEFHEFCTKLEVGTEQPGDNDFPEDVLGGLDKALEMNWSRSRNTKVIFHICDHPAHGTKFHNMDYVWENDKYPDGDPSGLTADGIFDRISEKGIDYYFGKITEHTDTMIKAFSDALRGPIEQFDIQDVLEITSAVISAVSESVSSSMSSSAGDDDDQPSAPAERSYHVDKTIPAAWDAHEIQDGKFFAYQFPNSIQDVVDDEAFKSCRSEDARIQMSAKPFAAGKDRIAYYARDLQAEKDVVLKEYIRLYNAADSAHRHEIANQQQMAASYFAALFMADCEEKISLEKGDAPKIPATLEFLPIKILQLGSTDEPRYMSCEDRLNLNGRYVHFTNNSKFIMPEASAKSKGVSVEMLRFVVAFSHYTFTMTGGKLMVVDLQGKVTAPATNGGRPTVQLTDPAIHCENPTRFTSTNRTKVGMSDFFESHVCNEFCAALGLPKVDYLKLLKA